VHLSSTSRSTPTRLRERARADRADLYAVLDAGMVCHVGVDDTVYVHGSTGAAWLRIADGAPICLTVTHLDGVVYARSVFHHSMNYRSAVVHGAARLVTDPDERWAALRAVVEQLSPGSWEHARLPDARELAATSVVALDLAEASVKVRTGPPGDDAADIAAGGRWAGVLPVHTVFGEPQPDPTLDGTAPDPEHVRARSGA
jgi:uncharacterized protein